MDFTQSLSPSLPFPSSHPNLSLTMPLYTDGAANMIIHNDPRVFMFLSGPPYPYTTECWDDWWVVMSAQCHAAAVELNEVKAGKRKWVGRAGNACNAIRDLGDVDENRVGKYLGSIGIRMADFVEVGDEGERKRRVQENEAFEDGDPRIEWEIGFFLSPEAHGRGIMPAALRLLMDEFAIPYMNAHLIKGIYYEHNTASKRVFEKCGFGFEGTYADVVEIKESKVGAKGMRVGVGSMSWRKEGGVVKEGNVDVVGKE